MGHTAIRALHAQSTMARTWPLRYLIRHTAFHTLDHAWEMQDMDMTGKGGERSISNQYVYDASERLPPDKGVQQTTRGAGKSVVILKRGISSTTFSIYGCAAAEASSFGCASMLSHVW